MRTDIRRPTPTGRLLALGLLVLALIVAQVGPAGAAASFNFTGSGWGHGVGMSQYGALEQARDGRRAEAIIEHYYRGAEVASPDLDVMSEAINIGLSQNLSSLTIRTNDTASDLWFGGPRSKRIGVPAGTAMRFEELDDGRCRLQLDGETTGHAADCWAKIVRRSGGHLTLSNESVRYGRGHLELRPSGNRFHAAIVLPNMNEYLIGLREVPASWPAEALRAQAIAGRSYAAYDLLGAGLSSACHCHLYDSVRSQVYGGTSGETEAWRNAVTSTGTQVVWAEGAAETRGGGVVQAFYSSSSGGRTEAIEDSTAFAAGPRPYFSSVDDPWSLRDSNPYASWANGVPESTIGTKLDLDDVLSIRVTARNTSGSARTVTFSGTRNGNAVTRTTSGDALRGLLGLRSGYIRDVFLPPFSDDDGNIHESAIVWLSDEGITTGCNPPTSDRFCPEDSVTRGQMAAFLTRALDLPPGDSQFADTGGSIFVRDIAAIADAGITLGCNPPANDRYCPDGPVTRAQMASFLARALQLDDGPTGTFVDVPAGSTHERTIAALAAAGITRGCNPPDNTRFCPDEPITRAQMATFLFRALG